MSGSRELAGAIARRRDVALAGHRGDVASVRDALADDDATAGDAAGGAADAAAVVRRRVAEAIAATDVDGGIDVLVGLLDDADASVVEVAAWACGEVARASRAVALLAR